LEFGTSPADLFHQIPIKEILGGSDMNSDFTLTYGEVIHDYLKAKWGPPREIPLEFKKKINSLSSSL
jgi:hypothetical protein